MAKIIIELSDDINKAVQEYQNVYRELHKEYISKANVVEKMCGLGLKEIKDQTKVMKTKIDEFEKSKKQLQ